MSMTESERIIARHSAFSFGVGVIPIPVVDTVGLAAIQLNLLRKLANSYELKVTDQLGSKLISTLIGTIAPVSTGIVVSSMVKGVPIIGSILGAITFPIFAAASTRALGRVFDRHFQSGGDLVNFDPRKYFDEFVQAFRSEKAEEENAEKTTAGSGSTGTSGKTAAKGK